MIQQERGRRFHTDPTCLDPPQRHGLPLKHATSKMSRAARIWRIPMVTALRGTAVKSPDAVRRAFVSMVCWASGITRVGSAAKASVEISGIRLWFVEGDVAVETDAEQLEIESAASLPGVESGGIFGVRKSAFSSLNPSRGLREG